MKPCQPETSIPLGGPPWTLGLVVSCWAASRIPAAILAIRQVDVVMVREPLETGEPVRLSVWALSEALHDVDDLMITMLLCFNTFIKFN